jgi:MoaA/NifB/PqqE/SkfB family radical SAM enzyme
MIDHPRPTRAILNFAHRCALQCEWCYVPFGQVPAQKEVVLAVISRIAELGFTSVTFGGGDPFQYSFISEVLRLAKASGLFVHVDTHGKSLQQSAANLELLESAVDLLGLPIDGSTSKIHDGMRDSPGHFEVIANRLKWLRSVRTPVKLNTVISAVNLPDVQLLASHVRSHAPSRWSVYQFWPLGPASNVDSKHGVSDSEFARAAECIIDAFAGSATKIEINARESRRDTYPIIHHDGTVFVHSRPPYNTFIPLGNISESEVMSKILDCCSEERPAAVSRYVPMLQVGR